MVRVSPVEYSGANVGALQIVVLRSVCSGVLDGGVSVSVVWIDVVHPKEYAQ